MLKEFISVLIFFWLTLWAVKASLLLMFRKLTTGLPFYERLWWYVMGFTIVTFVGCVISDFTSCSSFHAWFTAGMSDHMKELKNHKLEGPRISPHIHQARLLTLAIGDCLTRRDATAKAVSLWYALGVDLLTDLISILVAPDLVDSR